EKGLDGTTVPMEVYVKTQRGDVFSLEVTLADTVALLKEQLARVEGSPAQSQRLMWKGFNMQDERTLASYEVRHGAVIVLAPRLRDWAESKPRRAQFSARRGLEPRFMCRPLGRSAMSLGDTLGSNSLGFWLAG
ncbi:unnamed protein product, partial [Prorocentrum cordatum]